MMGTLATSQNLKSLESRLVEARAKAADSLRRRKETESEFTEANHRVAELERQIRVLKEQTKDPIVTEHALLRYIQRVMQIDVELIKREILTPRNVAAINMLRSCRLPLGDGIFVRVKDRTVVTVETKNEANGSVGIAVTAESQARYTELLRIAKELNSLLSQFVCEGVDNPLEELPFEKLRDFNFQLDSAIDLCEQGGVYEG